MNVDHLIGIDELLPEIKRVVGSRKLVGIVIGETHDEIRVISKETESNSPESFSFCVDAFVEREHDSYLSDKRYLTREAALIVAGKDCFACFD